MHTSRAARTTLLHVRHTYAWNGRICPDIVVRETPWGARSRVRQAEQGETVAAEVDYSHVDVLGRATHCRQSPADDEGAARRATTKMLSRPSLFGVVPDRRSLE